MKARNFLLLLGLACLTMTFISCQEDEDDDVASPLVGIWRLNFDASDTTINEYVVQTYSADGSGEWNHYRPSDNSFIYRSLITWSEPTAGTVSFLETFDNGQQSAGIFTYTVSGNLLTVNCEGCEPRTFTRQ